MATASSPRSITNADELLNGTRDGNDIFDTSNIVAQPQSPRPQKSGGNDVNLDIDEEIKIVKKRQPIPKLDDNRLLSGPGIPKLQRVSKERLKFKGKGHEYGDIARMLNMYQLWLDDLYPRAKFADGLAMIEKLGHTKRVQIMRKEWIDENKPRHTTREEEDADTAMAEEPVQQDLDQAQAIEGGAVQSTEQNTPHNAPEVMISASGSPEDPDDDELDDLLETAAFVACGAATSLYLSNAAAVATILQDDDDAFADDMDAMREMDDMS